MQQAVMEATGENTGKELKISLEEMEQPQQESDPEAEAMAKAMEEAAEELVRKFEQDMNEVVENMEKAEMAFDDLSALDGEEGFDLSRGTWRNVGWKEVDELRRKLENLRELRDLVRSLGRGGGKGPLRRAPEELECAGYPPGVIRSPLQPEEVRGLSRSGELSQMLPSEMALMAHGWPRKSTVEGGGAGGRSTLEDDLSESVEMEYYLPGAHAARMLHRVRRAERMLLSYERTGWLEDIPSRLTGRMEIRPAAELGPIILCLDTSGSMRGAREVVAKALALECMRGAHRQQRACYLYAFSGPGEVKELQLSVDMQSLDKLLEFLSCGFMGGTDVDHPLRLSLDRLKENEWRQADILMVTDGELAAPSDELLQQLKEGQEELGLEVHGLVVSSKVSEAMQKLCTHLHVFRSWTVVGGESWMY